MLISILTPYYHPEPGSGASRAEVTEFLAALAQQSGPVEVILSGTGPVRRDPLADLRTILSPRLRPPLPPGEGWGEGRQKSEEPPSIGPHPSPLPGGEGIGVRTIHLPRHRPAGRAECLNRAAELAGGDVLLILHADCRLPPGALDEVRAAVANGARAGAFRKHYEPAHPLLDLQAWWLNEFGLAQRGHTVGTNAVWLRRELWQPLPEVRLLEDVILSDRLRREVGPRGLHVSRRCVGVSAERYLERGMLPSLAVNAAVMALHRWAGWHPDRLRDRLYRPRP